MGPYITRATSRYPRLTVPLIHGRRLTAPAHRFTDQQWWREHLARLFHGGDVDAVPWQPEDEYREWAGLIIALGWLALSPRDQANPDLFPQRIAAMEVVSDWMVVEGEGWAS
jgi:hypothetical protein